MKKYFYGLGILTALSFVLLNVSKVHAHGFGERYDLPIPLGYFLVGAALTIILSFVIIGLFVSFAHKRRDFVPTRTLVNTDVLQSPTMKVIGVLVKIFAISIFGLLLGTGLFGSRNPSEKFLCDICMDNLVGRLWFIDSNNWKFLGVNKSYYYYFRFDLLHFI